MSRKKGSPSLPTRCGIWADETSRAEVTATATRWQATKRPQMMRLGKELVVKTKPRPVVQTAKISTVGSPVFFEGAAPMAIDFAVPVGGFAVPAGGFGTFR